MVRMLVLFITCFILGCGYVNQDAYPYQPLGISGKKITAKIIIQPDKGFDLVGKSHYNCKFIWNLNFVHSIELESVTNKCEAFLKTNNIWEKPYLIPEPNDVRYPWSMPDSSLNNLRTTTNPNGIYGYKTIKTIVCLEPVIVIEVQGLIQYFEKSGQYCPVSKAGIASYWVPNRGFAYGNHLPYDSNPQWFSPDLNILPQPVEMVSETEGRISVPWGCLVLTKQGDEWVVTAGKLKR